MMKSLLRTALALAIPATGILALPSAADANVRSTNAGTTCQWSTGEMRSSPNTYYTSEGTTFMLPDGDPGTFGLQCPLARNLPLSTAGYSDLELRFRAVVTLPGPSTVSCTAWTFRSDGSLASSNFKTLTIPVNVGMAHPIHVMDFANSLNASGNKGHSAVQCHLPKGVEIVSLYSSEVDGIDNN